MTAAPDARALAATPPGALLYLRSEPGPWNSLVYSAGFKVHRYLFVAVPVLLIIYSLWEIGLMLCTLTVWNWRMLIYISVIAYLVLFTLLQPYSMNSRAATMAIHVSWIAGYLCLSLFIVAWSAMVRKIHGDGIALRYHQIAHYCIAAVVALTLLVKLWAFAAQSYRLYTITTDVATYGIPAMLGTQTALLGMVVWSFLRCAFTIAISNHMRSVLKNMAALCVISLSGCLCMVVQGLLLATPASFRTGGYHAVSVLYHLGQCLLCIAILGVLWVKDHAKRTRPLLGQLEFRADGVTCTQHQLAPQRAQAPLEITALPRVPLSDGLSRGFQPDPIISISCA
ncbi:hypothetical protein IWQ56_004513 [Coemansia nantahalensis]|nr:hypothetical protein IWQ56_004513 [Coemansia nantahalensis]